MASASTLHWTLDQHQKEIDIYRSGANLKIVLLRPRNGNALTTDMVSQLTDCFRRTAQDKSISRIIITAEGKFFCTGMDLGKSTTAVSQGGDAPLNEYRKFVELFRAIENVPQVTISCLNGPCYAGGIGLAYACNIRLAVRSASATLSEVKLGLCPSIISKYLVREWGPSFAREAMLSGRTVLAAELKAIGAIHGLADDVPGLTKLLDSYLTKLRGCAPQASAMCKAVVQVAWLHPGTEQQDDAIKSVFVEMMKPGAESSVGIMNFQSGKKTMDWDSLREVQVSAKL